MQFIPMCHTLSELGDLIKSSKVQHEWNFCFRSSDYIEQHRVVLVHSKLKKKIQLFHNGHRMYLGPYTIFQWLLDEYNNKAALFRKNDEWHLQINNYDFQEAFQNFKN